MAPKKNNVCILITAQHWTIHVAGMLLTTEFLHGADFLEVEICGNGSEIDMKIQDFKSKNFTCWAFSMSVILW